MQYFRKHDTDNNHKLDGLELLKAIARMEGTNFSRKPIIMKSGNYELEIGNSPAVKIFKFDTVRTVKNILCIN